MEVKHVLVAVLLLQGCGPGVSVGGANQPCVALTLDQIAKIQAEARKQTEKEKADYLNYIKKNGDPIWGKPGETTAAKQRRLP